MSNIIKCAFFYTIYQTVYNYDGCGGRREEGHAHVIFRLFRNESETTSGMCSNILSVRVCSYNSRPSGKIHIPAAFVQDETTCNSLQRCRGNYYTERFDIYIYKCWDVGALSGCIHSLRVSCQTTQYENKYPIGTRTRNDTNIPIEIKIQRSP